MLLVFEMLSPEFTKSEPTFKLVVPSSMLIILTRDSHTHHMTYLAALFSSLTSDWQFTITAGDGSMLLSINVSSMAVHYGVTRKTVRFWVNELKSGSLGERIPVELRDWVHHNYVCES